MKIDTDLRIAIRSVLATQKESDSWSERRRKESSAIAALLKQPHISVKVRTAKRDLKRASDLNKKAGVFFDSIGLCRGANSIIDEEKFIKSGGKFAHDPRPQRFEVVMARIAAASEADGRKIIKELGINWA